ncbi:MAG: 2-methylcitrate dehydratase [Gammaproteobacteria bacterium]|nr:2-methylcitrate dehydratase [Gammaproteobacteria bacterium]|tara:strand:+ start:285 stop:1652 length:1368 start_codon:yes stop_codon:yes gene_type:complete
MTEASIAQRIGDWGEKLQAADLAENTLNKNGNILIDIVGLCIAARQKDYVKAVIEAAEAGKFTMLGHAQGVSASSAALVNGTAAHGEDFDDTFEGGPVHSGVVMVPAMLAAAERYQLGSEDLMLGLAAGNELLCRLALTMPKAIHKSGFHPTAVLGAFAAAFGIGVACKAESKVLANALGIAGSMASGIIEYLGDGSWTKRMHPGWAAQSGLRAYAMAKAGFVGPQYVFEGEHGVFKVFAASIEPKVDRLFDQLGKVWVSDTISFKPYPTGTMGQPYIDCARKLREQGVRLDEIESILCETAEGYVHRLWEPLQLKQRPPTPYAAKFSVPFGVALGLVRGHADLGDYTDESITDPDLLNIAARVGYEIDENNPYPAAFTGHVRLRYRDGTEQEVSQGYMRGGREAPLSQEEIEEKFYANCRYGNYPSADDLLLTCKQIAGMQGDYTLVKKMAVSE